MASPFRALRALWSRNLQLRLVSVTVALSAMILSIVGFALVNRVTTGLLHRLNRDAEGRVKCVACFLCATACPAHCIDIVAAESPWPDREKYPESFTIDELRCIYCGMCEEACPVDAVELTSMFDLTGRSREEMIFDKEKLLSVFDQTKDKEPMKSATLGGKT